MSLSLEISLIIITITIFILILSIASVFGHIDYKKHQRIMKGKTVQLVRKDPQHHN